MGANWESFLPNETKDYLRKVTGNGVRGGGGTVSGTPTAPAYTPADIPKPRVPTVREMLGSTPGGLFGDIEQELREIKRQPRPKTPSVSEITTAKLTEGMTLAPVDDTPVGQELVMRDEAEAEQREIEAVTTYDRFKAGMQETLFAELWEALDQETREDDPDFNQVYLKNWKQIESFAQNDAEVAMLREAGSAEELADIQAQIEEDRERARIIGTAASPTTLLIGTGILDPAGWLAGFGVGKGLQLAGVGSRALASSGRPGMAILSSAGEGAVGNLAVTAGLDASGDYVEASEYALSALTGSVIGGAIGGITVRAERGDKLTRQLAEAQQAREAHTAKITEEVETKLGPEASPEAISEGVQDRIRSDYMEVLDYALADIPENQRLGLAEELLVDSDAFKARVAESGDLDGGGRRSGADDGRGNHRPRHPH